jgi:leucyl aminopeptidase
MKLSIRDEKTGRADAFVVFATAEDSKPSLEAVPRELRERVRAAAPPGCGGEGAVFTMSLGEGDGASRLYLFGIGKSLDISPRRARAILRSAVKALNQNGERSAIVDVPFRLSRMKPGEAREFLAGVLASSDYAFTRYKTGERADRRTLENLAVRAGQGAFRAPAEALSRTLRFAETLAETRRIVRDLGNTPSNELVPRQFADFARTEAARRGIRVHVLDKKAIAKERMGGLLAVNAGSFEEARFVVLEYSGAGDGQAPIALVGKGVTFDSGGISIKPAERMGDMKWDMMGAATVLGSVLAAADLKLPVNLVGLMPLTENLPSGSAYKPGDIVRFRSGKTAEIDNTDAEGRVILADALDYAKEFKPRVIVDYATLTGAALVALGLEAAIVFCDDDALVAELVSAGERTDERLWRLPMWDDYKENIRSEWADLKNSGGRMGGSINGAMFLKEFVEKGTRWAHLDIAPTAYYERDHAGYPVGATAFGVALTLRWLRDKFGDARAEKRVMKQRATTRARGKGVARTARARTGARSS